MPFPIEPRLSAGETESLFLIQDPFRLRRSITPVFVAPHNPEPLIGLGTSFFIDPMGTQLTAMHVLTDVINGCVCDARRLEDRLEFRDSSLGILHDPGLVYGMAIAGAFLHIQSMFMFPRDRSTDPMAISLSQRDLSAVEPAVDLASLEVRHPTSGRPFNALAVDHGSQSRLAVGAKVMAIGYPHIVGSPTTRTPDGLSTTYSEEMYGSIARVTELFETNGPGHNRWPTMIVDQTWPPGMSGGPIFDENGRVIGVVSRGGPGFSSGVWLQCLPSNLPVFSTLDPANPGWVRGWCVYDPNLLVLRAFCRSREEAERSLIQFEGASVAFGSHRYGSSDFVILSA